VSEVFQELNVHERLAITGQDYRIAAVITGELQPLAKVPLVEIPEAKIPFDLISNAQGMHLGYAELAFVGTTCRHADRQALNFETHSVDPFQGYGEVLHVFLREIQFYETGNDR
jgi:hypothetical protein